MIRWIDGGLLTGSVIEDGGPGHPDPSPNPDVINPSLPSAPPKNVSPATGEAVAGYTGIPRSSLAESIPKLPGHRPVFLRVRLEVEIPCQKAGCTSGQFFEFHGQQRDAPPPGFHGMVFQMRVEHGKRLRVIEANPGAYAVLTAPVIARPIRSIAEPEASRFGRFQIPVKYRRKLPFLLSVFASCTRPSVLRKHCLQVPQLIDQHLLKTHDIGTMGFKNRRYQGTPVFPDVVTVAGRGIAEVEA